MAGTGADPGRGAVGLRDVVADALPAELAGMRIEEIRITFKEGATVWWAKAEEEYVAVVNAKAPAKSPAVKPVRFNPDGSLDKTGAVKR